MGCGASKVAAGESAEPPPDATPRGVGIKESGAGVMPTPLPGAKAATAPPTPSSAPPTAPPTLSKSKSSLVSNTFSSDRNSPRHSNDDASPLLDSATRQKKNKPRPSTQMDALLTGDAERRGELSTDLADAQTRTRRGGKLGGRHGVTAGHAKPLPISTAARRPSDGVAEQSTYMAAHHGDTAKDAKTLAWLIACVSKRLHLFSTLSVAQQEAMVGRMFKENVAENEILIQLGDETAECAAQFCAILSSAPSAHPSPLTAGTATSSPPAPSR